MENMIVLFFMIEGSTENRSNEDEQQYFNE